MSATRVGGGGGERGRKGSFLPSQLVTELDRMTLPGPKENETCLFSCPPFPNSGESMSDVKIRMESERSFTITSVFHDPVYARYRLKGMDVNVHVCRVWCVKMFEYKERMQAHT
jgi:hypothetical protein